MSLFGVLDIHTHILPSDWPDFNQKFGYGDFLKIQHCDCNKAKLFKGNAFFREIQDNCWNPIQRIKEMEETGVRVQVLSTVPVMFNYWAKDEDCREITQFLNNSLAETCAKYPKKFIGLATIPMQNTEIAIQELKRCKNLGFAGVQIATHINDKTLDDPSFFPIFEALSELSMCVFVHPWDMMGSNLMKKYWLPWLVGMPAESSLAICSFIFSGIFEKLPNLRVAFAHGGGSFPGTIGRIEHGFHARPDLVCVDNNQNPRYYLGKFWVDSLVHDCNAFDTIVNLFGTEKICVGSDYPFPLGEQIPGEIVKNSNFSSEIKSKIMWNNALEWLGVSPSTFD